jgi:large subunit ribosomal protein L24
MNTLHIKKNDLVVVIAGADKGKTGKVLVTLPEARRVVVEGVNVMKKAIRKSQDNPKGGIITKEFPIAAARVMLQEKFELRKKKRGVPVTNTAND